MSSGKMQSRLLLVTANVATCFEQPAEMLSTYLDELLKELNERTPDVFAVHCQEVGGKNYLQPATTLDHFLEVLLARPELEKYTRSVVYFDGAATVAHQFTALGNLYFFHDEAGTIETWNFQDNKFVPVEGRSQYTGSIEEVPTKEKSKFPQNFFPDCKWSRKGFMRTRWNINGTQLDLINIHLFHDANNFSAMKECPSEFALNRRRALQHTLDRFHCDSLENVPYFIFGDFNFRLDTKAVIGSLTENCTSVTNNDNTPEKEKLYYLSNEDGDKELQLKMSKRIFRHAKHQTIFSKDDGEWLRPHDLETNAFKSRLSEMSISFPPSYPFEEDPAPGYDEVNGKHYAYTRLPGWCDRVMISTSAKELMSKSEDLGTTYQMLGRDIPMGDHKPICLCCHIPINNGIVRCCEESEPCSMFVHNPQLKKPCYVPDNLWCVCYRDKDLPLPNPKRSNLTNDSSIDVPSISAINKSMEGFSIQSVDRRESLFSEGGCGGVQCNCVSEQRRCSEARVCETIKEDEEGDFSDKIAEKKNSIGVSDQDGVSLTSSMRVEHDSIACDSEQEIAHVNKSVECISITSNLSKTSKDIYTKLETMRENKTQTDHSMNNLLVSDSGSDQISIKHLANTDECNKISNSDIVTQTDSLENSLLETKADKKKKKMSLPFRKKKKKPSDGSEPVAQCCRAQ